MISKTLKTVVGFCGPKLGFESKNVSARYLHAADAMYLLCLVFDSNVIKLIGRWRSNDILSHLQVQS